MVGICLTPSWGNSSKHNSNKQAKDQEQPRGTPSTNGSQVGSQVSGQPAPHYAVDRLGEGTSTKSCFNIFSSSNGHSHKRLLHNSVSSRSSQSSRQPLHTPHSVESSISIKEQQEAEFAKTWESFSQNQFEPDANEQWNITDGEGECLHLLQPPKPTDRSHKQRMKLEQEKRQAGVYEGELEPEGVRGQEALLSHSTGPQTATPLRTFGGRTSLAAAKALSSPQRRQSLETIAEISESPDSDRLSRTMSPLPHTPPRTRRPVSRYQSPTHSSSSSPQRSVDPPAASFESNSTSSDEDIERMMSDFLKQSTTTTDGASLVDREYPNPIPMPRTTTPRQVSPSPSGSPANRVSPDTPPSRSSKSPPRQPSQTRIILPPAQNQHSPESARQPMEPPATTNTPQSLPPTPANNNNAASLPPTPATTNTTSDNTATSDNNNTTTTNNNNTNPPPQNIDAWNTLALQHVHNGEYDMALAAFQHVLRSYKQQYGTVHPLVASAYHNLGTVHAKRAQLLLDDTLHQRHCRAQSLQCFQSAARAARDSLGRDHPNVAVSLVRIGFLLLQARQYNNAVITFQEALRIRQAHYGPHHALVANLYNNLGVCYMHLGQFAHGRDLLHHALAIQRALLQQSEDEVAAAEEKKSADRVTTTGQALELADTLFNIGGLALEWIRRQGPDVRHAEDAEAAFEEALELRKSVLGPKDPMVLQVKSLLDMARSIPRPKSPGRRMGTGHAKPTRGNGNVNYHPHETLSRPPDPLGVSPGTSAALGPSARKGDTSNRNLSPPRTGAHADDTKKSSSPYRYYGKSDGSSMHSSTRLSPRSSPPQQSSSTSPVRHSAKADYLEPPRVNRRSLLDQGDNSNRPPEKPRHALSPTMGSQAGRQSYAESNASTVQVSPSRRHHQEEEFRKSPQDIFRPESRKDKNDPKLPPPMTEIAVSQDEDDDGLYDPAALQRPAQTNIFISPHFVPQMSPHKVNHTMESNDDAPRSVASSSYGGAPFSTASSSLVGSGGIVKTYSYDPEEQLVLTDGLGAEDDPLPDDYDALSSLPPTSPSESKASTRKIMVVRPYRSAPDDSITSPTSVMSSKPWDASTSNDAVETSLYSSELEYSSKTTSYDREASKNSRSVTLSRARALLQAHNPESADSPQLQLSGKPSYLNNSPDRVKQQLFDGNGEKQANLVEDLEDGLAPLGATDTVGRPSERKAFHQGMLTNKPEDHLREIYEEASRCLKNHQYIEATAYFRTILQCQRRLHGPVHQDVASALHNSGLAQLRAGNHHEALKSFEEAVRIRKGTLGREHPHVASSLVKCGITFLLLHRFEEALWSFREALSIRKHSLGTLHPSTARVYNNIGAVHVEFNELTEARRAFEGALDIQRNALCHDPESGPVRFGLAATLCNLGYLYRYRGMHERAAQVLREAADIQEDILGGTHPTVLSTLDSLAGALSSAGQGAEAFKTLETILDRFESTESLGSRRLIRAEAGLKYKMSQAAKQTSKVDIQIKNLQQALQAVRSLDEQTEAARSQAADLEKRILSDLREAREAMEANQLNWV